MAYRYIVLILVSGSTSSRDQIGAATLRHARSIAYRWARSRRPHGLTGRPVYCDGGCWHDHPDADGMHPVGGYDVGDDGSAAVIFSRERAS